MACWPCPGWAASYICCCQPRGSHRFGQPICGSLATRAASRVDRYAAARQYYARGAGEAEALERPALGSQIRGAVTPTVPGDVLRLRTHPFVPARRWQSACGAPCQAVKPCAAVQPRAAHNALQPLTVTTDSYRVETRARKAPALQLSAKRAAQAIFSLRSRRRRWPPKRKP